MDKVDKLVWRFFLWPLIIALTVVVAYLFLTGEL